ncbi:MAG: hypothetical protein P1U89_24020 [Verrucomicrobiales bacterium]|nr:hypothetical protein [Verrucomicrobiales bacterium]
MRTSSVAAPDVRLKLRRLLIYFAHIDFRLCQSNPNAYFPNSMPTKLKGKLSHSLNLAA